MRVWSFKVLPLKSISRQAIPEQKRSITFSYREVLVCVFANEFRLEFKFMIRICLYKQVLFFVLFCFISQATLGLTADLRHGVKMIEKHRFHRSQHNSKDVRQDFFLCHAVP
ncbi:hypothetical protein LDENG_00168680 [Lucifuga dentata]|nr:hypothetical protein LDENG_00168680 [Lucifuga dentata]